MSRHMQKQSAYVCELYALTEAVHRFRHYLIGHCFIICTNQKSLKHLCSQEIQTLEQQKWVSKFMGFDFSIEYKLEVDNVAIDALSSCFLQASSQQQCPSFLLFTMSSNGIVFVVL